MMGLFRAEWNRMRRSHVFLVFLFIFTAVCFFSYMIMDMVDVAKDRLMFDDLTGRSRAFPLSMQNGLIPLLVAFVFPGTYVGILFRGRSMSQDVMAGVHRFPVVVAKVLHVQLLSCLLCAVYPLVAVCLSGLPWLVTLDVAGWLHVLRCIIVKALFDMGTMCTGIILGFLFKDFYRPTLTMLGMLAVCVILVSAGLKDVAAVAAVLTGIFSPWRHLIVEPATTVSELLLTVLPALFYIILPIPICWLLFRKTDLN